MKLAIHPKEDCEKCGGTGLVASIVWKTGDFVHVSVRQGHFHNVVSQRADVDAPAGTQGLKFELCNCIEVVQEVAG
jgi:hypothetical protein